MKDKRTKSRREFDALCLREADQASRTLRKGLGTSRSKVHVNTTFRGAAINALPETLRGVFKTLAIGDQ